MGFVLGLDVQKPVRAKNQARTVRQSGPSGPCVAQLSRATCPKSGMALSWFCGSGESGDCYLCLILPKQTNPRYHADLFNMIFAGLQ